MKTLTSIAAVGLLLTPLFVACASTEPDVDPSDEPGISNVDGDSDPEVDEETAKEAVATSSDGVRKCYCGCKSSKSTSYMYSKALTAMHSAKVTNNALRQTVGDAAASVGTHCPEPGKKYSAATDLDQGGSPCARTHALRMQGFAAWYRTAPEFPGNKHIHAVYPAPGLKSSLKSQVNSFLNGRNGLVGNAIDKHCPITEEEKQAVKKARGDAPPPPKDAGPPAVTNNDAGTDAGPPDNGTPDPGQVDPGQNSSSGGTTDPGATAASASGEDTDAGTTASHPAAHDRPAPDANGGCSISATGNTTTSIFGGAGFLAFAALLGRRRKR